MSGRRLVNYQFTPYEKGACWEAESKVTVCRVEGMDAPYTSVRLPDDTTYQMLKQMMRMPELGDSGQAYYLPVSRTLVKKMWRSY